MEEHKLMEYFKFDTGWVNIVDGALRNNEIHTTSSRYDLYIGPSGMQILVAYL